MVGVEGAGSKGTRFFASLSVHCGIVNAPCFRGTTFYSLQFQFNTPVAQLYLLDGRKAVPSTFLVNLPC